jgi:uncharacterized protein YbaR (Trm112 family)
MTTFLSAGIARLNLVARAQFTGITSATCTSSTESGQMTQEPKRQENGLSRICFIPRGLLLLALLACPVDAKARQTSLEHIQEMIVQVRTARTTNLQADAAYRLSEGVRKIRPGKVDDKTFADLVSLMDSPKDFVRAETAAALGFLGERAKPAIPKLLEILPKVDCLDGAVTSAGAIRLALMRIGVMPPLRRGCIHAGG